MFHGLGSPEVSPAGDTVTPRRDSAKRPERRIAAHATDLKLFMVDWSDWSLTEPTPSVAQNLMPRDIMSSEPRNWMVFGQLVVPVQCCAGAPPHFRRAQAQHCTGMTNWPHTIRCLGSDDIMSLGIKSSAFLKVEPPFSWKFKLHICV